MQPDDYKSIDLYLQNELPQEELDAFHARVQADPTFADELNFRQGANNYLRTKASQIALEQKMASLGEQYFQPEAKVSSLLDRRWLIGVAAAVLLGLMFWLWNPFTTPDLYTQYAEHPQLLLAERGVNASTTTAAETAFNAGHYAEAYITLQEMLAENPDDTQLLLAAGITALETGRIPEAETAFTRIANGNSSFKSYGYWYLALSSLKSQKMEKVKSFLLDIDDSDPVLKNKAVQLLGEL